MSITIEAQVEQTRNSKYQKIDAPKGSPIYHVGFAGQDELAGKKVRVTVEVIDA